MPKDENQRKTWKLPFLIWHSPGVWGQQLQEMAGAWKCWSFNASGRWGTDESSVDLPEERKRKKSRRTSCGIYQIESEFMSIYLGDGDGGGGSWEGFMLTKPEKVVEVASTSPSFSKPAVKVLQPPQLAQLIVQAANWRLPFLCDIYKITAPSWHPYPSWQAAMRFLSYWLESWHQILARRHTTGLFGIFNAFQVRLGR